jgi:DNA polymerase elongation subunit (family B)
LKSFYTSVFVSGNNILYRGVIDGKKVKQKVKYEPSFYLPSTNTSSPSKYKSLTGIPLTQKKFDTITEAKDFYKNFEGLPGAPAIYGTIKYDYAFIAEQHTNSVEWDLDKITVAVIDIEVGQPPEGGFPDPYKANGEITAIGVRYLNGEMIVFGCGDYEPINDVIYVKCKDEWTLCKKFLELWTKKTPDVVTGWNVRYFDIPYLVNRFTKIVGDEEMKKLSPWSFILERTAKVNNTDLTKYELIGLATLDYIELYKLFAPGGKSQDSYKLDNIASVELNKGKLAYDEYADIFDLHKQNFQKFIEYNIRDIELVVELEDKLKLIELALTLAYDTKTNYEDVFTQTRMWDSLTYSYLLNRNIIVPPSKKQTKIEAFEGAYVKDVQVGMHNWVASFDLNSLYPHLLMQYNISPETLVQPEVYTDEMRKVIANGVSVDKLLEKKVDTSELVDATLTPNGQFFRTDIKGFLPTMMEEMYEDRKKFKKMMLQAKQEYENETDDSKKYEIEKRISRYDNLQLAKKLSLNSAYGALGSQFFRFFDLRMAMAVTTAGQLSIRWIANKINEYMNKIVESDNVDYIIASDTDSVYLSLGGLVTKFASKRLGDKDFIIRFMDKVCEDKLQSFIDKSYQELAVYVKAPNQKMQMKREALADKGIWTAKKRYILNVYNNEGVQYKEPHLKVMGLDMIKSSTPHAVREKMKDTVKLIMTKTEMDIQSFIKDFRDQFFNLPPEDISFPRGVNGMDKFYDSISVYKSGTPIHVKGALLYNNYIIQNKLTNKYQLIKNGDKIRFTYLKKTNPFKDTVISFPTKLPDEFKLNDYVDYETQFQKTFIEPIRVILDCVGWKTEKQNSLEDFFS